MSAKAEILQGLLARVQDRRAEPRAPHLRVAPAPAHSPAPSMAPTTPAFVSVATEVPLPAEPIPPPRAPAAPLPPVEPPTLEHRKPEVTALRFAAPAAPPPELADARPSPPRVVPVGRPAAPPPPAPKFAEVDAGFEVDFDAGAEQPAPPVVMATAPAAAPAAPRTIKELLAKYGLA